MTEIEIERKGGALTWLWVLLALLLVGLLIWWLFARDDDAVEDPVVGTAPAMSTTQIVADETIDNGSITDLAMMAGADGTALVGRQVDLRNVLVVDVVGDASFWVEGSGGSPVYVVLNEQRTPDTATEGRVEINPGDRVNLTGTVSAARNGAPEGAAAGSVTDTIPANITQFIFAQSAEVVS